MTWFRGGARFREVRFSGFQPAVYVPSYIPLEKRGYKIIFYSPADIKLGEIGSDIKEPSINSVEFELLDFGCGGFRLIMDERIPFEIGYRTRVDIFPYFSTDAWFTGFIMEIPQKFQTKKPYEYGGFGYYEQLDWVLVNKSYEDTNLSVIIKNIIETMVAPKTHIKYNAAKVASTGVTVASINFDHVYAKDALQTLTHLISDYEFGVDAVREFYFRAKDTAAKTRLWATKNFTDFWIDEDILDVKNRLYVKGGAIVEGSNIIGSVEDAGSITAYGVHEDIITAPEILNFDDAITWAQNILAKTKLKKTWGEVKDIFLDEFLAPIEPKGKAVVTDENGIIYELPIKTVKYNIAPRGIFATLQLEVR